MIVQKRGKPARVLVFLIIVQIALLVLFGKYMGRQFLQTVKSSTALKIYNFAVELCMPQLICTESEETQFICADMMGVIMPSLSYENRILLLDSQGEEQRVYEQLALLENEQLGNMMDENRQALQQEVEQEEETQAGSDSSGEETQEDVETAVTNGSENTSVFVKQAEINRQKLNDFDYLRQNYYQVDSSTTIGSDQLNAEKLLSMDMTLKDTEGEGPQILIYHTHSQEGYKDSVEGDSSTTVVGVGEYLTELLTGQYGLKVLHHTGEYDVGDREHAYSNAAPALEKILAENPTIQVVIDLHRDGVAETTHLVTEVNGKQTAQIMFFNGLCRTTTLGDLTGLPNPYIQENMAFSLQMQVAAAEYYPGLTRKIYLKGYRYNMHYCPQSLLVEVGAQTNTLEEAMNAMEPLAALLNYVLTKNGD